MGESTTIPYVDKTFNPWIGCSKVHTGCEHCYAEAFGKRLGIAWGPDGTRRKTGDANWKKPLAWNRAAEAAYVRYLADEEWAVCEGGDAGPGEYRRPRVFPSLCDPMEVWDGSIVNAKGEELYKNLTTSAFGYFTPSEIGHAMPEELAKWGHVTMDDLRRDLFALIDQTPFLDWPLLTKRPENILRMVTDDFDRRTITHGFVPYRQNVHLYYSASDQTTLDVGLPHLLKCRDLTPVLGVSLEPLTGPVDLGKWIGGPDGDGRCKRCGEAGDAENHECPSGFLGLDHVIIGGESGPNARPCNVEWIRSIVGQCAAAGVPCFLKQIGARPYDPPDQLGESEDPDYYAVFYRDPKGGDPAEWPDDLQVRELPKVEETQ